MSDADAATVPAVADDVDDPATLIHGPVRDAERFNREADRRATNLKPARLRTATTGTSLIMYFRSENQARSTRTHPPTKRSTTTTAT